MAWRQEFLNALAGQRRELVFWVACEQLGDEPGQPWTACSHDEYGADSLLVANSVQIQGATLDPYNWTSTIGAFSFEVWGSIEAVRRALRRGSVLVLRVGFPGFSLSEFEPVAFGVVRTWSGFKPRWRVQCHDIFSSMQNRLTTEALVCRLFDGLPDADSPSTTLTSAVAVGDSSYPVASTALFGSSGRETGGVGLLLVETSLGDPYYRLWSGTTAGPAITIDTPATASLIGTTDLGADSGDNITLVGYLSGHPLEIVRKILHSTGSGTNAYDTYPSTWGYGIPYEYVDSDDIQTYIDASQVSGTGTSWQWAQVGPVDSGLTFLQSFLAPFGGFLAIRQGKITARCGFWTLAADAVRVDTEITDAEVVRVEEYSAYDFGHQLEYTSIIVATATGSGNSSVTAESATLPTGMSRTFDLSDRVFSDEADHQDEVIGRLFESQTRVPERLVLTLAGLARAALCVGDIVKLTTSLVASREGGDAGFSLRDALVVEVSPDWVRGVVRVALWIYPAEEGY